MLAMIESSGFIDRVNADPCSSLSPSSAIEEIPIGVNVDAAC